MDRFTRCAGFDSKTGLNSAESADSPDSSPILADSRRFLPIIDDLVFFFFLVRVLSFASSCEEEGGSDREVLIVL